MPDAPPPDAAPDSPPPVADVGRVEERPEYAALAAELADLLAELRGVGRPGGARAVVGVAGETGSGKSVTASSLARALTRRGAPARVVHQDDYFLRPPAVNHAHRVRGLDNVGPHEVNLKLIAEHVAAFRAGRDGVEAPLVDYPNDRFLTHRFDFSGLAALVVEGTYVLRLAGLDARVFLEATHRDTYARRRARARDLETPIEAQVLDVEHRIVREQAAGADVIIGADFRLRRGQPT